MTEVDAHQHGDWRRPAARGLLVTPLRTARELIPTLAPVVVVAVTQGGRAYWLLLLLVLLPVLIAVLRWWSTGYRVANGAFQVRRGILRKHLLTAQLDRIRTVDAEASLLRRVLRIVDLHVGTGAHESVSIHGIDAAAAAELHRILLARQREAPPGLATPDPGESVDDTTGSARDIPGDHTIAAFTPAWLRFAPFTMSGVAVALTAWAVGTRIVNEFRLGDTVAPWLDRVRDATAGLSLVALVINAVVAGLLTLTVLSLAAYALANWGFRLTRRTDATLHIRRGLLTSRAVSIEERRLRGVVLERPMLLRIPGGAPAKALVTGGNRHAESGLRATHLLLPPAPAPLVTAALADVLGTGAPLMVPLVRHGPRANRRRYSRALLALTPLTAALAGAAWHWSWPTATYGAAALLLALAPVLGALRARWLGHALLGDPRELEGASAGYLVASSGAFPQERDCLRARAIIGWVMHETFFQRRAGLVTLEATVATSGGAVKILDVPREQAIALMRGATPGLLDRYLGRHPTG